MTSTLEKLKQQRLLLQQSLQLCEEAIIAEEARAAPPTPARKGLFKENLPKNLLFPSRQKEATGHGTYLFGQQKDHLKICTECPANVFDATVRQCWQHLPRHRKDQFAPPKTPTPPEQAATYHELRM